MANITKTVVLLPLQTLTTPTTLTINAPGWADGFIGLLGVGTVSGTSPTLDVKIEQLLPNPLATDVAGQAPSSQTYSNYKAVGYGLFAQITSSNTVKQFAVESGVGQIVASQGNPTADNFRAVGPVGGMWKITFTVAGTSPSFANAYMVVQFSGRG